MVPEGHQVVTSSSPQYIADAQIIDKILSRLAEVEKPPPRSLEFYRQILNAQKKAKKPDSPPNLAALKEKAPQRLAQGKPMLTFREVSIDWAELQKLFQEIAKLSNEYISPVPEEVEELNRIGSDPAVLKEAAKTWFAAGTLSCKSAVKNRNIKPLAGSVLQACLHPWLAAYADELLPVVRQEKWHKKYCPVCGGGPDFAFLEKGEGARWLICSRCDAKWLFYRLVCPHCGNHDQRALAYFTDDKGLYRLHVCEKCRRYIKAIDLRKTEAEILLPLERVLTLDMDRQAYELKYKATE